jgi:glycosyltransferase involved in cell wall biosynthesis
VACSNRTSLPEVAGDAALMFDPDKPEEIAAAIERLLTDPDEAERLRAAGYERARQFTWDETARLTAASYERALGP